MTVCAARSDDPGFFTSCNTALRGPCVCGALVAAELINDTDSTKETR